MVTIRHDGGGVYDLPSIQRAGGNAGIASLTAELAALPTSAIAEQIMALAEAPADLHDLAAGRFQAAALELARRTLAPPRRRVSSAELGQRLIAAIARYAADNGMDGDARLTALMCEWVDWRDRITPAGRRALRKLEGGAA